jgi:hypothetical protein
MSAAARELGSEWPKSTTAYDSSPYLVPPCAPRTRPRYVWIFDNSAFTGAWASGLILALVGCDSIFASDRSRLLESIQSTSATNGSPSEQEIKRRAQEVFDAGIYAALELCRLNRHSGEDYNAFDAFEQRVILLALRATNGNQFRAAKLLGINPSTLRKRMKKHEIRVGARVID